MVLGTQLCLLLLLLLIIATLLVHPTLRGIIARCLEFSGKRSRGRWSLAPNCGRCCSRRATVVLLLWLLGRRHNPGTDIASILTTAKALAVVHVPTMTTSGK